MTGLMAKKLAQQGFLFPDLSYEEQPRGWLQLIAQARSPEDEILAYKRLESYIKVFSQIKIIGYDSAVVSTFQSLRASYRSLGKMDLKIAAIAISCNAILLTRNLQDFGRIVELNAEDWT